MENKLFGDVCAMRGEHSVMLCKANGNVLDYLPQDVTDDEIQMWISGFNRGSTEGYKLGMEMATMKVQENILNALGIERKLKW